MYQNVPEGKFIFFEKKTFKVIRILLSGTWSLLITTDIVEVINTLIQEKHNHSENCITVKVFRKTQKIENYLENERSALAK